MMRKLIRGCYMKSNGRNEDISKIYNVICRKKGIWKIILEMNIYMYKYCKFYKLEI